MKEAYKATFAPANGRISFEAFGVAGSLNSWMLSRLCMLGHTFDVDLVHQLKRAMCVSKASNRTLPGQGQQKEGAWAAKLSENHKAPSKKDPAPRECSGAFGEGTRESPSARLRCVLLVFAGYHCKYVALAV